MTFGKQKRDWRTFDLRDRPRFAQKSLLRAALLAIAAAALLAVCSCASGPTYVETGFARALKARDIDSVLVVGDSISAGYGTAGRMEGVPRQILFTNEQGLTFCEPDNFNGSWVNHLRTYLENKRVKDFLNASISGSTFSDLIDEFDLWVGDGADAIVVMLGTNDVARLSREEFEGDAAEALEKLAERCEYLLVISPPKNGWERESSELGVADAEDILSALCEEHGWDFVSAYDALEPNTGDYQDDQVHPTSEGGEKLWDYIAACLGFDA